MKFHISLRAFRTHPTGSQFDWGLGIAQGLLYLGAIVKLPYSYIFSFICLDLLSW